jgi:putative transposase
MSSDNADTPERYPSDLLDEEWAIIETVINELEPYKTGRKRDSDLREILNAIFYLNKTGCPWRYLPKDFPSYHLVNYYYNKWTHSGLLEKINADLRARLRQQRDRNPDPSGSIIDSQSVKGTPESSIESGFAGGKLVKGRKRHIVVDTMGCLLVVYVHAANIYDGKAARDVLERLFVILQSVKIIWADCGYLGDALFQWVLAEFQCTLEVVKRKPGKKGFHVLPRRWVVERTFAWLGRSRRLSRYHERNPGSSESQVYLASSRLLLRQLCDNQIAFE